MELTILNTIKTMFHRIIALQLFASSTYRGLVNKVSLERNAAVDFFKIS